MCASKLLVLLGFAQVPVWENFTYNLHTVYVDANNDAGAKLLQSTFLTQIYKSIEAKHTNHDQKMTAETSFVVENFCAGLPYSLWFCIFAVLFRIEFHVHSSRNRHPVLYCLHIVWVMSIPISSLKFVLLKLIISWARV